MTTHDAALALSVERHDAEVEAERARLDAEELELVEDAWTAQWSAEDAADAAHKDRQEAEAL